MRARLVSAYSWDVMDGDALADPGSEAILVEMEIGPVGEDFSARFSVTVGTTDWLQSCLKDTGHYVPRHLILTDRLHYASILNLIEKIICSVDGKTWSDVSAELNKYFASEYDHPPAQ